MNHSRDLVDLREELKETVTCFLCHGENKGQENLTKIKSIVKELEELSLFRGSTKAKHFDHHVSLQY